MCLGLGWRFPSLLTVNDVEFTKIKESELWNAQDHLSGALYHLLCSLSLNTGNCAGTFALDYIQ